MKFFPALLLSAVAATVIMGFRGADAPQDSDRKYLLELDPETGRTGTMVMDYDLNISMDVMGMAMEMDQNMEMGAKMTILANDGKEVTTGLTYEYVSIAMDNPMTGNMEYDSREDNSGSLIGAELDAAFSGVIGKEVKVIRDKTGKTLGSEGLDELDMKQNQGGLDFSSVMGMSAFPDKPVAIGESWSQVIESPESPMKFDMEMTLKNVSGGKAYIDFDATVSSNENFANADSVDISVSGTQTGTFIYELDGMWMLESLINQDLQMSVVQMGMTIPMDLKGKMILTVD